MITKDDIYNVVNAQADRSQFDTTLSDIAQSLNIDHNDLIQVCKDIGRSITEDCYDSNRDDISATLVVGILIGAELVTREKGLANDGP